jgi:hypothetical protein
VVRHIAAEADGQPGPPMNSVRTTARQASCWVDRYHNIKTTTAIVICDCNLRSIAGMREGLSLDGFRHSIKGNRRLSFGKGSRRPCLWLVTLSHFDFKSVRL